MAFGQSRALFVWSRIMVLDSTAIWKDKLAGVDGCGFADLEDKVDDRSWKLPRGIVPSTLLGARSKLESRRRRETRLRQHPLPMSENGAA
ncbi:MAG: TrbI/VirB10 family protein [Hyphomonas sp.]|nr:TrbI/VirB10 family protein [Hyphomonas sp.]